jgi:S1-C subfamily serine protease
MRERFQKAQEDRIRASGLTPERVQSIERRAEELRVAAMQAQYEAQRTGQRVDGMNVDQALRRELGDAEYERYLKATGQPTEVRVMEVLATSAAERAGLKAGDEIVSYAGKRVFDARELNAVTTQGNTAGTVTVEVKRDGQTVQLSVPAGPLGVSAGGGRGGPGGGGPPGGFRGGRPGG